jgi:hypothetical protein
MASTPSSDVWYERPRWVLVTLEAVHHVLAVGPALLVLSLYGLFLFSGWVLRQPAEVLLRDPGFSLPRSLVVDLLSSAVHVSFYAVCFAVPLVPALSWALWGWYSRRRSLAVVGLFLVGLFLLLMGAWVQERAGWFLD